MDMSGDILQTLSDYISNDVLHQKGRKIAPDAKLISSGLVDSLKLVDLALFVEENFGVQIDDTELNAKTFDTLAQLVALIESRA
jgi:acyl carrier protein